MKHILSILLFSFLFCTVNAQVKTYHTNGKLKEMGKEAGKELKNQGKNLWDKANELIE